MDRIEKAFIIGISVILAVIVLLSMFTTPMHYDGDGFMNIAAKRKASVTEVEESYGPDPLQVVTIRRGGTTPAKTVIFFHGGGWNAGGRGSLRAEELEWSKTGWTTLNASYRLGIGQDDGRLILADVLSVLELARSKAYVDPSKVVIYGESAGGHLATWLGARQGHQVAATVAISPVTSIGAAITAGAAPEAPSNVASLGARAALYFGYSPGTTSAARYVDRAGPMFLAGSADEWVSWEIHGADLCRRLGDRCTSRVYPGTLHAGALADAQPQLLIDVRHWADAQL